MNAYLIRATALHELRLRTRRLSTIVAVLAVMAVTWMMIPDFSSGHALIAINGARAVYDSNALSMGSALLASLMFGLGGFYLVRGRMHEDIRSGAGGVIGATSASNAALVVGRWLGGILYLLCLALAVLGTVLVLHLLRGEGPIELLVYLRMYALVIVPNAIFVVGMATLCEAVPSLMGKRGDIMYFFLWVFSQAAIIPFVQKLKGGWHQALLVDFGGNATIMSRFIKSMGVESLGIGAISFDAALAPIHVATHFWTPELMGTRLAVGLIAVLPLLPAILLFHRFSPDRVRKVRAARRTPAAVLNAVAQPLTRVVRPL
ncbi:MAG TPA: hypothetical protein VIT92_16115, partial [Burkholderiaceae bacterium]